MPRGFEGLQRLGRALMLPIAVLPVAGLLFGLVNRTCWAYRCWRPLAMRSSPISDWCLP